MANGTIWPRKPKLTPRVEAAPERHRVDGLRGILSNYPMDCTDPARRILIGNDLQAQCGDIEDLIRWTAEVDAFWIKTGVMLGLIAAVASIIAAVEGWLGLIR
jgi:hypothetical protein